jgi:hypothetical protein
VSERTVADFQVLAQGVQREKRAHLVREEVGEELERGEVPDGLEVPDVLPEEPVEPLPLPPAQGARRLREEGLREAPELQQRLDQALVPSRGEFELLPGR